MKIFVIAAKMPGEDRPWILNAWDEWSVDANDGGFEEAVAEAVKKVPGSEVRVGKVEVPDSFLFDMFKMHQVEGKPVEHQG